MTDETNELQQAATDLTLAATTLFESGDSNFTLPGCGKNVQVKPATMRHIGSLMQLFAEVVTNMDQNALATIIGAVSQHQQKAIAEGRDPNKLDMTPAEIVEKALGNTSVLSELSRAGMEIFPKVVSNFSNVTEDEFLDMPLDDATMVAGAIFMVNYDFFTQRLLPTLVAFARSRASKHPSLTTPAQQPVPEQKPRGSQRKSAG